MYRLWVFSLHWVTGPRDLGLTSLDLLVWTGLLIAVSLLVVSFWANEVGVWVALCANKIIELWTNTMDF